jgi:CRISPR-associated protein Cas1
MIKRTLYFENPAYLSASLSQLKVKLPAVENNMPEILRERFTQSIPIEDIGVVVLDNPQITITQGALEALSENNCAIVVCDKKRMPSALLLPLSGNTLHTKRIRLQAQAALPLKKQLWKQTVQAKIQNQTDLLDYKGDVETGNMRQWKKEVRSGDTTNLEARAAVYYWANLFPQSLHFNRERYGLPPNNLLNYGYSILRSIVARALVSTGLSPALGIHHKNKYNAYTLADDIMEPYRPVVDKLVLDMVLKDEDCGKISKEAKIRLLTLPILDVKIDEITRPLMIAAGVTAWSLQKCFAKESKVIAYPQIVL